MLVVEQREKRNVRQKNTEPEKYDLQHYLVLPIPAGTATYRKIALLHGGVGRWTC
jgi:hypothetical protein